MSEIELPAPRPPRSRLGTPRAVVIDGAGAGDGEGEGEVAGAGEGELAGPGAVDGDGADVASVFVDDDPPPQAATAALRKAMAARRAWDVGFSAIGILLSNEGVSCEEASHAVLCQSRRSLAARGHKTSGLTVVGVRRAVRPPRCSARFRTGDTRSNSRTTPAGCKLSSHLWRGGGLPHICAPLRDTLPSASPAAHNAPIGLVAPLDIGGFTSGPPR